MECEYNEEAASGAKGQGKQLFSLPSVSTTDLVSLGFTYEIAFLTILLIEEP